MTTAMTNRRKRLKENLVIIKKKILKEVQTEMPELREKCDD